VESQIVDRRKFRRLETPISLVIKLLGTPKHPQPINAETTNISREGLLIELQAMLRNGSLLIQEREETIKLIPFLILNKKMVELDIEIKSERQEGLDGMTLAQGRNHTISGQGSSLRK